MAKSLRSKVKRRWRSLRRRVMDEVFVKPNTDQMNANINATVNGYEYRQPKKKNAFLNPEDPEAVFPQYVPEKIIDMRSAYVPFGGNEWVGARRKPVKDVQILVDNLHGQQTEFENEQVDDLEAQMDAQDWKEEDEGEEGNDKEAKKEEQNIELEGGVSKRALIKSIVKGKKTHLRKPHAKSKKLLKF